MGSLLVKCFDLGNLWNTKVSKNFSLTNSLRCGKILTAELWRFCGFFLFPLDFFCQGVSGKIFGISTLGNGGGRGIFPLPLGLTYSLSASSVAREKNQPDLPSKVRVTIPRSTATLRIPTIFWVLTLGIPRAPLSDKTLASSPAR